MASEDDEFLDSMHLDDAELIYENECEYFAVVSLRCRAVYSVNDAKQISRSLQVILQATINVLIELYWLALIGFSLPAKQGIKHVCSNPE